MKNIAVIGAGTMGNGIAHVFAQNEFKVHLIDVSKEALANGIATISRNLDRMVAKEKITEADRVKTVANITCFTDLPKGVKNVDLVVEAATENISLKLKIFKELDKECGEKYDGFKNPKYAPSPLLVNMVTAGKLGIKSGEGFYDYSASRKAEIVSNQFTKK